jgi:hypothetical protein
MSISYKPGIIDVSDHRLLIKDEHQCDEASYDQAYSAYGYTGTPSSAMMDKDGKADARG